MKIKTLVHSNGSRKIWVISTESVYKEKGEYYTYSCLEDGAGKLTSLVSCHSASLEEMSDKHLNIGLMAKDLFEVADAR